MSGGSLQRRASRLSRRILSCHAPSYHVMHPMPCTIPCLAMAMMSTGRVRQWRSTASLHMPNCMHMYTQTCKLLVA